jgi:glycosyltransferase involved in cell wall biosynthesis
MKALFIHQNFPGQFVHLAPALAGRGHEVHALRIERKARQWNWQGVQVHAYWPEGRSTRGIHPWVADIETKTLRGEACWRKARALAASGFAPDLIYAHPGWGEALFLKQVWPAAKLMVFGEFFYGAHGADTGFDPEFSDTDDDGQQVCRLQMKNLNHLAHLAQADAIVSPTRWQASRFPLPWRERIEVIHDGIDTDALRPDPAVRVRLGDGLDLTRADEVITFVARHLEPYRGFHTFMRALPALLRERLQAHVLIVGEDGVSYGAPPTTHRHWRERMLAEIGPQLDAAAARRVHFVGRLEREAFTRVLQLSRVHVYLTYPFVLSWSLLEAMSIGCAIVGSDTAPVREVIAHGQQGLLADFFDPRALVRSVVQLLDDEALRARCGAAARQRVIARYDLIQHCLPRHVQLVETVAASRGDVQPPHEVLNAHP